VTARRRAAAGRRCGDAADFGQRPGDRHLATGSIPGSGRVGGDRQPGQPIGLDEEVLLVRSRNGEPPSQIGEALAQEALGRVDQERRMLQQTIALD